MGEDGLIRTAVVFGVIGPAPGAGAADLDTRPPLTDAETHARRVAESLVPLGFPILDTVQPISASDLEQRIEQAASSPGVTIVHVASHGELGNQEATLYVRGPEGARTPHPVNAWLTSAEDGKASAVLFIFDVCHAGAAVDAQLLRMVRTVRQKAWVLAATGAKDPAFDLRLTRAVAEVCEDFANGRLRIDVSLQYIPLARFCQEVDRAVQRLSDGSFPQQVHSSYQPLHVVDDGRQLLRNPHWQQPVERASARLDSLAAALVDDLLDDDLLDSEHFMSRAAGAHGLADELKRGFFQGRDSQLRLLRTWAQEQGPHLRIVTGKPGVGKSALLGLFVCAAHPRLRQDTKGLWAHLPDTPPRMAHDQLAVVHARQRSVREICASLARQWTLDLADGDCNGAGLIKALRQDTQISRFAVVDAVDEAEEANDLVFTLLLPLTQAVTGPEKRPLCRLLVGSRPGVFPDAQMANLLETGSADLMDLGQTPRDEMREVLQRYVAVLMTDKPPYDDAVHAEAIEVLAETIADSLAGAESPGQVVPVRAPLGWGEFLVAGMYVRRLLLTRPDLRDATAARRVGAAVPTDIRGLFVLDLTNEKDDGVTREVATALAYAQGAGMPENIARYAAMAVLDVKDPPDRPSHDIPLDALRTALQRLRFYLRRDVDEDGSTLFRLFHQGLADQLRSEITSIRPAEEVERAIWHRLHEAFRQGEA